MTTMDLYRLPGGRLVPVDRSAAKGAEVIDFTLEGGRIVQAVMERGLVVTEDSLRRALATIRESGGAHFVLAQRPTRHYYIGRVPLSAAAHQMACVVLATRPRLREALLELALFDNVEPEDVQAAQRAVEHAHRGGWNRIGGGA